MTSDTGAQIIDKAFEMIVISSAETGLAYFQDEADVTAGLPV